MNKIEDNVKIVVIGFNTVLLVNPVLAIFTQNISIDFIPDVVEIKTISYYENSVVPQNIYALSSNLCNDNIMCAVAESYNGGNGMCPHNLSIPLKKPINGKYTFTLVNIQTGLTIQTAANSFLNFGMTLRFVKYK